MILRHFQIIWLMCIALFLGGCVASSIADLEEYVEKVLAKPGGRIEPLPPFKPYKAYAYQSAKLDTRDPFKLFYQKNIDVGVLDIAGDQDSGLSEEMNTEINHRNKEELEEFELDSLRMVGTMDNTDHKWGIIKDPDGVVHTVEVGNYLGRNIGKILHIFENSLEIREIVKESSGLWEERKAVIALDEQE